MQLVLSQHQARTKKRLSLKQCSRCSHSTRPGPKSVSLKLPRTVWAALQPALSQHQARTKKRLPEASQDCVGCPAAGALTAPGQDQKMTP